jgi:hypothetical protein
MAVIIPLLAVPNQTASVLLAGQNCQINIYQKTYGLYMDLLVDQSPIFTGVVCEDRNLIKRYASIPFSGDFAFVDLRGAQDPEYAGLGSRYYLAYFDEAELD